MDDARIPARADQTKGRRIFTEDSRQVIVELHRRGYILGIISNLITSRELPDWLEEEHLTGYFKAVALSSLLGIRKPSPEIYLYAARQAGVEPSRCAYIGDNLNRDVTGTRAAGFGIVIILPLNPNAAIEPFAPENHPDLIIRSLSDLLEIFP
jgi:putative hydrolase of the HAD superfamily